MMPPSSVLDTRVRALTLGLPLVVTLFAFDNLGVTTVMPKVAHDLSGLGLYGWAFSAFTLASIIGLVDAGRRADRVGPAPGLAAGLALFVVGLIVTASAPDMAIVVVGRALQGLGSGAFGTTMYVVIGRAYPAPLRPRMFAVLSTAWVVPSLVGPALAGFVADTVGWRAVFVGLAVVVPLPMLGTVPKLRALGRDDGAAENRSGSASGATVAAAIGVAIGTGSLLAGLGSGTWIAVVLLAVPGLAIGIPCLARTLPAGTATARRGIPSAVLLRGILNVAFFGTDAFIPLLLVRIHHQTATVSGIPLTAAGLTWTAASWAAGRLRDSVGTTVAVSAGVVGTLAGTVAVLSAVSRSGALAICIAAWAVAGAGMGLAFNLLSVTVVDLSPDGQEGVTASGLQIADALGVGFGTGVGGALVALGNRSSWGVASALTAQFALNSALLAGSLGLGARLDPHRVRDG